MRSDETPETTRPEAGARRWARRLWRPVVAVIAAFGVLGAVGGKLVDDYYDDVVETVRGEGPLLVAAGFDASRYDDGFGLVVADPSGLVEDPGIEDCGSLLAAARRSEGADIGSTGLSLLIEGRTHKDAAIVGMRARIVERGEPLNGTRVSCASAGDVSAIGLAFDLDEQEPRARVLEDDGSAGAPYFGSTAVTFTRGEVIPFQVLGTTARSSVEWVIEAEVLIDGERDVMVIDDQGEPFRTTAALPRRTAYRSYVEWAWFEDPQRLLVRGTPPA